MKNRIKSKKMILMDRQSIIFKNNTKRCDIQKYVDIKVFNRNNDNYLQRILSYI